MEDKRNDDDLSSLSECSDKESFGPPTYDVKRRKFDEGQLATLTTYYSTGMKGVGKAFSFLIERAASETGLSADQVKVC